MSAVRSVVGMLVCAVVAVTAAAQDHSKPKATLEWRSELIRSLAFTSDGKFLVVSPKDNDVWVFHAETGEKLPTDIKCVRGPTNFLLAGPRPGTIYCFEKLVSRLVDVSTGKELAMTGLSIDHSPSGMLSAKKDILALAGHAGGVELLTADLARSLFTFDPPDPPPQNPKDWRACAAAYSADGKFVAGARPNGRLFLYAAGGFQKTGEQAVSAHAGKIDALAFTPAGLLSLGIDGKLKRWSTPEAKEIASYSFSAPLDRGWLLANGQVAAVVNKPVDGELKFFQVPAAEGDQLKLLATIPIVGLFDGFPTVHREFSVPQIALSPDGLRLALAGMAGSNELAITRVAIYDVSGFMPKLATASATDDDPRVTGSKPPTIKSAPTPATTVDREVRTWSTADGLFSVEAQFLSKTPEIVRLKRKDTGKVIVVPLEKLSEADREYVKSLR